MLDITERLVVLMTAMMALEVCALCVYGAGSDLTKKERELIGDQIQVTSGLGEEASFLKDRAWVEFLEKQRRSTNRRPGKTEGRRSAPGTNDPGDSKDRSNSKGEPESHSPTDRHDWLLASDAQWEHWKIPAAVRDTELSDLNSAVGVLQKAEAELITLQDGSEAYRITDVDPGSLIEKVGYRPGDILISVNGERVGGPQDALRLFGQFQDESHFVVELMRDGQPLTLFYTLE